MDWTLEVVVLPVADIDRAIAFYRDQVGFALDHDTENEHMHVAQLTPPGSGCSIHLNSGLTKMPVGGLEGLQLIVADIEAAHAELVGRGVEAGPIQHFENGGWLDGKGGDWNSFVFFSDPDGNGWVLQERPAGA
jgi:catechol 2,3-dioxygenase-like lactoylglutathione lyase family enzyme